jgi:SprT protein
MLTGIILPTSTNVRLQCAKRTAAANSCFRFNLQLLPMQQKHDLRDAITPYFPADLIEFTLSQMLQHSIQVKLARPRKAVHGWFKATHRGRRHTISLNINMKPWMMFLVFVHELAHLKVFEKHGRRVLPHGKEWKESMRTLIIPLIEAQKIPEALKIRLAHFLVRVPATFNRDKALMREIMLLDGDSLPVLLSDWPFGKEFALAGGKRFVKIEKLRTRYRCISTDNKRHYLISGHAEIIAIQNQA